MATSDSSVQAHDGNSARRPLATRSRATTRVWWRSGAPFIWLTAGAVGISVITVVGLLGMIAVNGLGHFWPSEVISFEYQGPRGTEQVAGILVEEEEISGSRYRSAEGAEDIAADATVPRWLLKTGNRDHRPPDFRWVYAHRAGPVIRPADMLVIERTEWGHAIGTLVAVSQDGAQVASGAEALTVLARRLERVEDLRERTHALESGEINAINWELNQVRLEERRLELEGVAEDQPAWAALAERRAELQQDYSAVEAQLRQLYRDLQRDSLTLALPHGEQVDLPLATVIKTWQPNAMSWFDKLGFYIGAIGDFLSEDPREANTEGGIFPAIFGTVLMVLLMSVVVTPFGVIAAIYLREYAHQGVLVRTIRIAVNNLAGVPSIVYGVFGLGFFVYFVGAGMDRLFYPEALPSPTFGTPGLFWASLTLALLTVPVVIVSTEEGLTRIPRSIREGSLALGATKAETLYKVVLPMASPSILTGVILAIARAAGEVAPLMLVGVVKLAPTLPVDGNFPFIHLERKFMHLGFHIYDVGFQSPNVDAARPLVFATAFLLVLLIIVLNLTAILLRNRLEDRYRAVES